MWVISEATFGNVVFTVVIPPTEPPSICSRSLRMDFLKRLSLIVSTSDQVVHISDITVVVIVHHCWHRCSPGYRRHRELWRRSGGLDLVPSQRGRQASGGGGHYIANGRYELGWWEDGTNHLPMIATNLIPRNAVCVSAWDLASSTLETCSSYIMIMSLRW